MTVRELYVSALEKSSGRTKLPTEDKMIEGTFVAMKQVAMDTLPLRLTRTATTIVGERVLRKIDFDTYVKFPKKPDSVDEELEMDEFLIDAMAFWVIKGLEPQVENRYYRGYKDHIDMNNGRLIETMLSEDFEDSTPRNCYFP